MGVAESSVSRHGGHRESKRLGNPGLGQGPSTKVATFIVGHGLGFSYGEWITTIRLGTGLDYAMLE